MPKHDDSSGTARLIDQASQGDRVALDRLIDGYRIYLRKLIDLRMDDELRVSRNADYQLDCSRVDAEELEDAKKTLHAMNFDGRFKIHTS